MTGRRAVIRWASRMFRREWRQQALIVTLLTVAVAAAVAGITVVYNTAPADNAAFGSANHSLKFDAADPRKLAAGLAAAKRWFGTTDVVVQSYAHVPGSVERVYYFGLDPSGPYLHRLVSLRRGSYPRGAGQVAVTDGVAKLMRLHVGSTLRLDGRARRVVGIVENTRKLSDEFALVTPSSISTPHFVTVLIKASNRSVSSFFASQHRGSSALLQSDSRPHQQAANALAMFSVATVFLLLAALVGAAGFAVIAQRRLRHLGMLAAIGATQKHLRLVLLANGAFVGAISALFGALAGVGLWLAAASALESATDHRIDRFSLPWGLIGLTAVFAVLAATLAAWWPGRAAARLPVVLALSGRPAKPRPVRQAALAAFVLLATGVGSLTLSHQHRSVLIVVGIVATIGGTLLLGPPAIRLLSGLAGRFPIAPRLALRDLGRYQARSGAALAAVTVALGIASTIVVVAAAEAEKRNAQPPNLSGRQVRIHLGPSEDREGVPVEALSRREALAAHVRQLAAQLDDARVIPLGKVIEGRNATFVETFSGIREFATLDLTRTDDNRSFRPAAKLFVATPTVLRYLGVDPATVDSASDFLVYPGVAVDELVIPSFRFGKTFDPSNFQRITTRRRLFGSFDFGFNEVRAYTPPAFITPNGLRRHGWTQVPSGWLVESSRPLTSDQIARVRRIAAEAGFTIELRRTRTSFARAMGIATAAGALLALGILALTVGLIRSESAGDLRTLTATGAPSAIRRSLTATTAGALALLGAFLGIAAAYAALIAMHGDDLGYLRSVPFVYLALAIVGVPVVATAAGWLLSGREPPAIARPVIE
jgi:putative ABC transport system permease protein